jgi:hypothetical protein
MRRVLKEFEKRFTISTPATVRGRFRVPSIFVGETKQFTVYGKSFFDLENVYLSGIPFPESTFVNPFSSTTRLSAIYPGFFGVKLSGSSFVSNNDYYVTFTMPSASFPGFVDIILQNRAGYGALTQYVIRGTFNPYTSGTVEYNTYTPYVRPWSSGVRVLSGVVEPTPPLPPFADNQIFTLNGLSALQTFSGINIVTFTITP